MNWEQPRDIAIHIHITQFVLIFNLLNIIPSHFWSNHFRYYQYSLAITDVKPMIDICAEVPRNFFDSIIVIIIFKRDTDIYPWNSISPPRSTIETSRNLERCGESGSKVSLPSKLLARARQLPAKKTESNLISLPPRTHLTAPWPKIFPLVVGPPCILPPLCRLRPRNWPWNIIPQFRLIKIWFKVGERATAPDNTRYTGCG